ncbi:MAG: TlpA disulfide reductase family protein [bacterium]|nr:TlpA disulfide reductase family protein [bacterium]
MASSTLVFSKKLKEGIYRGALLINPDVGLEIPFNFEVIYQNRKPKIIIRNADERIVVDEIQLKGDSLFFKMPVFDTEFKCKIMGDSIEGQWINHYRTTKNFISFNAQYNDNRRFLFVPGKTNPMFEGKWEVTFSPGLKDSSKAIGIFKHLEQTDYVTGTFLTETGDYRYLEGMRSGNKLFLSCFDGSHAYLFEAELINDMLEGTFYSGAHYSEKWKGIRNDEYKLRDAEEITYLKNNDEPIDFTFPDLNNKMVSLSDAAFKGKPVIIQLMGTWCPNCLDESRYFSELFSHYHKDGLEIIALAFEKTEDAEKARKQVLRLKERLTIDYTLLVTSRTGKDKAAAIFPFINEVSAFPTAFFLNKQHQVVKIHTGFSGPATGQEYVKYKERTENLINVLIRD